MSEGQYDDYFFAQFSGTSDAYGASSPPTLGAGRSNPVPLVKLWSTDLNALNDPRYTNVAYVMGSWMPRLTEATRNFQQDQGIGVDGKVGPNTRAAMVTAKAAVSAPAVSAPAAADQGGTSDQEALAAAEAAAGQAAAGGQLLYADGRPVTPVPFLEQETWSGGPTVGVTLTIGGIVLGGLGLFVTLLKALRPAPGMANRHRDC